MISTNGYKPFFLITTTLFDFWSKYDQFEKSTSYQLISDLDFRLKSDFDFWSKMVGLKNQPDNNTVSVITQLRFQVEKLTLISGLKMVGLKDQPNINTNSKSQPDFDFRLKSWLQFLVENWYINVSWVSSYKISVERNLSKSNATIFKKYSIYITFKIYLFTYFKQTSTITDHHQDRDWSNIAFI